MFGKPVLRYSMLHLQNFETEFTDSMEFRCRFHRGPPKASVSEQKVGTHFQIREELSATPTASQCAGGGSKCCRPCASAFKNSD